MPDERLVSSHRPAQTELPALVTSTTTLPGMSASSWRLPSSGSALLDETLVAPFVQNGVQFVRVAVFDPAENFAQPSSRLLAHHAAAIARKWLASEPDPAVALTGANNELWAYSAASMSQPCSTTVVFADVVAAGSRLEVVCAGVCGDGTLLWRAGDIWVRPDVRALFDYDAGAMPVWEDRYLELAERRRFGAEWPALRWQQRPLHVTAGALKNPPLGAGPLLDVDWFFDVGVVDAVVVATDGAVLERADVSAGFDVDAHVRSLPEMTPPVSGWSAHGDVAVIELRGEASATIPDAAREVRTPSAPLAPVSADARKAAVGVAKLAVRAALDANTSTNAAGVALMVERALLEAAAAHTTDSEADADTNDVCAALVLLRDVLRQVAAGFAAAQSNAVGAAMLFREAFSEFLNDPAAV